MFGYFSLAKELENSSVTYQDLTNVSNSLSLSLFLRHNLSLLQICTTFVDIDFIPEFFLLYNTF